MRMRVGERDKPTKPAQKVCPAETRTNPHYIKPTKPTKPIRGFLTGIALATEVAEKGVVGLVGLSPPRELRVSGDKPLSQGLPRSVPRCVRRPDPHIYIPDYVLPPDW